MSKLYIELSRRAVMSLSHPMRSSLCGQSVGTLCMLLASVFHTRRKMSLSRGLLQLNSPVVSTSERTTFIITSPSAGLDGSPSI